MEDRFGACSYLAEITARMDLPQTVRAPHPYVCVRLGSWRNEILVGRTPMMERGIRARFPGCRVLHRIGALRTAWCGFADPFRLKRKWVHVHKLPARQRRRTVRRPCARPIHVSGCVQGGHYLLGPVGDQRTTGLRSL